MIAKLPDDSPAEIVAIYGGLDDSNRIIYPGGPKGIQRLIFDLRKRPGHLSLTDGAFDVPTDNHEWWLRDCRHHAAEAYFGSKYRSSSPAQKRAMIASDEIVLVVTIDADVKVLSRKGYQPDKGNIARPVYDWPARARRVAGYMIPDERGGYRPTVDLVTVEGDPFHHGTALESHLSLGAILSQLDIVASWILSDDHPDILAAQAVSNNVAIVPKTCYAKDHRTGRMWTSSYIIDRIRGVPSAFEQEI